MPADFSTKIITSKYMYIYRTICLFRLCIHLNLCVDILIYMHIGLHELILIALQMEHYELGYAFHLHIRSKIACRQSSRNFVQLSRPLIYHAYEG